MDCKSLVPSISMTRLKGELISMRCARPTRPLRPGLKGSSQTVRRPFRQSSMTRTEWPCSLSVISITPGQRASKARRLRVVGTMPQVRESEYTSTCCIAGAYVGARVGARFRGNVLFIRRADVAATLLYGRCLLSNVGPGRQCPQVKAHFRQLPGRVEFCGRNRLAVSPDRNDKNDARDNGRDQSDQAGYPDQRRRPKTQSQCDGEIAARSELYRGHE